MKRSETRRRNRAALVEAALAETAAHGWTAARLEDIAARAGLTTGAVYSLFGSKRELLLAAVAHLTEQLRAGLAELVAREELTLEQALRAHASLMHRLAVAGPAARWYALEVEAAALAPRDPGLAAVLAGHAEAIDGLVRRLLTGRAAGPAATPTTPGQAARLAPAVRALATGLARQALADPAAVTEDYAADAAAALARLVED
ncbi:hypothetical protein GCM10027168_74460 [Streptomyces capparidis]